MSYIIQIHNYITKHNLLPAGSLVIVGLSGGPDSVFLLHILASRQKSHSITLIAAHLDHGWRPESAQEALFCKQLCADLNIPFVTKTIAQLGATLSYNGSKEEYARRMRRFFFEQVKKEYKADLVALGHHAIDQQETFLIRLIRGATVTGLCSMKPKHSFYIRPLLETNKEDIINYLLSQAIPYVTDPTNTSLHFLRNRVRHQVLPALHTSDSRFAHNFQRAINNLHETERFLEKLTKDTIAHLATYTDNTLKINLPLFHLQDLFMQQRILMHMLIHEQVPFTPTQRFLQEIIRFLNNHTGTKTHRIHQTWFIIRKQSWAYIEKISAHK